MLVKELIAELRKLPKDAGVHIYLAEKGYLATIKSVTAQSKTGWDGDEVTVVLSSQK